MAPPINRDGYRAYADLRVLMTELMDTPDAISHDVALGAIRIWLRTHCVNCGAVVPRNPQLPELLHPTCWDCDVDDLRNSD